MADQNNRPEGTDTVIDDGTSALVENESVEIGNDAEATPNASPNKAQPMSSPTPSGEPVTLQGAFQQLKQTAADQTSDLRAQVGDRARDYVGQGKDKATEALENLARMVSDAAAQVEDKVGPDYAVYARRAADAVTGVADGLKAKDIDVLINDAKGLVTSSPALAIGAAAALGFVVARLAKSGFPAEGEAASTPKGEAN